MVYHVVKRFALSLLVAASACSPAAKPNPAQDPVGQTNHATAPVTAAASSEPAAAKANGRLTIAEARRYMLTLINRDRKTLGLGPVELDEGAPTKAAQAHTEDMAKLGYLGHWGSDGSVPEQRHTEAGGVDMVLENALCFTDEKKRSLEADPRIEVAQIEKAESQFFDEQPPNDGHRKNILKPAHTKVGIGVAQIVNTPIEIAVPCFTQEFTDVYATYDAIPQKAKLGDSVHIAGIANAGAKPTGIGIARVEPPKPIATSELNKRRSYPVPKPYQMYWGPGFVTPMPIKIEGQKFSIDVPLNQKSQPGLYEISVWAELNGSKEHTMIGLRTIRVE